MCKNQIISLQGNILNYSMFINNKIELQEKTYPRQMARMNVFKDKYLTTRLLNNIQFSENDISDNLNKKLTKIKK